MPLSRQEIIDTLHRHFIVNRAPHNYRPGFISCSYGRTKRKGAVGCAIGCLLPPETATFIDQECGAIGVHNLLCATQFGTVPSVNPTLPLATAEEKKKHADIIMSILDLKHVRLYMDLQYWHDISCDDKEGPNDRESKLRSIAMRYNIPYPGDTSPCPAPANPS